MKPERRRPDLRLQLPPSEHEPSQKLALAIARGHFLPHAAFQDDNVGARLKALDARSYDHAKLGAWLGSAFHDPLIQVTSAQNENLSAVIHGAPIVLTGQQPGLLGGPLLGYLKALSAIALAQRQSAILGRPVVPVFWVAGDDSDLAEANSAEFLWEEQKPGLPYPPLHLPFSNPHRKWPVGDRLISREAHEALLAGMPETWSATCRELIAFSYAEGRTLVSGFIALMQKALGHTGLLFADANSFHLRDLTQKPLREILGRAPDFFAALRRGEEAMQSKLGLKPQVVLPPGVLPGFKRVQGERERIAVSPSAGNMSDYMAGHTGKAVLAAGDILQHDALTRMVATEAVMPVLGHVLGPAEMRYAAQLAEVFTTFTGGMPLLHPRQSALLVPEALAITLEAHGMPAENWPSLKPSAWRAHLRQKVWRESDASVNPPSAWFAGWQEKAEAWASRHAGYLPLPDFARRLQSDLSRLELSVQEAMARRLSPYRDATSLLRPLAGGAGQDRHLNLMSVWAALNGQGQLGGQGNPGNLDGIPALETVLDPLFTGTQIFTFAPTGGPTLGPTFDP